MQGLAPYTRLSVVDLEADQEQLPKVGLCKGGQGSAPTRVWFCAHTKSFVLLGRASC